MIAADRVVLATAGVTGSKNTISNNVPSPYCSALNVTV